MPDTLTDRHDACPRPLMNTKIGEEVALPSGRRVKLAQVAAPERPWTIYKSIDCWYVVRDHELLSPPTKSFYYDLGKNHPMALDEDDAKALAEALNVAR
jgi:hypothetical protein